jgi:uncharacterized protein (TIGR00645 family)
MDRTSFARQLELTLFTSRWLLAPFYVGLVFGLIALLCVFALEVPRDIARVAAMPTARQGEAGILMVLSLIDLTLTANLVVLVILSSYENFIARMEAAPDGQRPAWMGKVGFSGLKMKLIASIVAISAVALLRTYLELDDHPPDESKLRWEVFILLTFVASGVLLAIMDLINSRTEPH